MMLRNYIRIALRNLKKDKFYAVINILGLSIGLACTLIIILFIKDELSYDKFHTKADRIYRVGYVVSLGTGEKVIASSPFITAPTLEVDFPELEYVTHFSRLYSGEVRLGEKKVREDYIAFADSVFFKVFDYKFLKGDPETALLHPLHVVITEDMVEKYFGDEDPIGKTIEIEAPYSNEDMKLTVSGVIENMPSNSHFHMNFLVSMATGREYYPDNLFKWWGWDSQYTYVVLPPQMDPENFKNRLLEFGEKHIEGDWFKRFFAQPIKSIHLHSDLNSEIEANSDISYIYIFSIVGIIIIVLASVNYMNLATARSLRRTREVGIRKSVGAHRKQLIVQFLSESVFISIIAMILGGLAAELAIPFFNEISGKEITQSILQSPELLIGFTLFSLLVGIASGSYPAFFLSSFQASVVLKGGNSRISGGNLWLRKLLVTLQFILSIGLIIGTIIVYHQLDYLRNKKLGVKTDQIIIVPTTDDFNNQTQAVKNELLKHPGILNISFSNRRIGRDINSGSRLQVENDKNEISEARISTVYTDYKFLELFDAELLEGRLFSEDHATDTSMTVIFNESAIQAFGFENPENALGRVVRWGGNNSSHNVIGQIVGIVKDFHFEALYNKIKPMVFFLWPNGMNYLNIKISKDNIRETINHIEQTWHSFESKRAFRYFFLDENLKQIYKAEERFLAVFGIFAGMAIFTACLGIFGLASFMASQRTKEIGIRKVFGASVTNIWVLLTSDFLKLVIFANILAWPITYWAMNSWLQEFVYRTEIYLWVFVLSGVIALIIAFFTVIFQAIKAAFINPAEALQNE